MKRIVSILLAMIMVLSTASFALAEEATETVTESEALEEKETLSPEEEYAQDVRHDEIIQNSRFANYEEDDSVSLMATYKVQGKITFPTGVKANTGDIIYVELMSPASVEEGLLVEEYGTDGYITSIEPTKGSSSVSYTATVSATGEYILAVKYFTGHGGIMGDWLYYTADGLIRNPYLADVINVKSSGVKNINMTLPASEASITGTIDLSDLSITKDGYVYVYATNMDYVGREYDFYCSVPVEKGDKSVDYELGIPCGNYYVAISSSYSKYCYYTSAGATSQWDKKEQFYVGEDGKVIDIAPLAKSASTATDEIDITINFKDEADGAEEYIVMLVDEFGEDYDSTWMTMPDGSDSITTTLELDPDLDCEIYVAIKPVYNPDGWGRREDDKNFLYYSSSYGFVGSLDMATDVSNKTSVTVTEQAYVTIKGDCSVSGATPANTYKFIGAQFENESFCAYVPVGNGTYQIKVPKRLAGEEFTLFTAAEEYNTTAFVTYLDGTYKLKSTSTTTAGDVDFGEYVAVSGRINLPFATTENGAVVSLSYSYQVFNGRYYESVYVENAAKYVFAEGETGVEYSLAVPANSDEINIDGYLTMYENVDVADSAYTWVMPEESLKADLDFVQSARLTGTISLPDGMTLKENLNVEINVQQDSGYNYSLVVIPAGQTSVDYSVKINKHDYINYLTVYVENPNFVMESYYNGSEFTAERYDLEWFVEGDIEASGTLIKASALKVNVTVPDSAEFTGTVRMRAYADDRYGESSYSSERINVTSNGTYELLITVPQDDDAEYSVYVNVYEGAGYEGNLLLGYYHYTASGWLSDYNEDNKLYITTNDDTVSFTVPMKATAPVKIAVPEGAYATEGFYMYITIVDAAGNQVAENRVEYDVLEDQSTTIEFPDTLTGNVYVEYYVDGYGENNLIYGTFYYNASGPVRDFASASAIGVDTLKTKGVTLEIEKEKCMMGKVEVNGTYKSVSPLESFDVILESVSNNNSYSISAKVDSNLNYSASFGSYIDEGEYYVSYALYSYQASGTNLLEKEETQLLDANGNRVTVLVTENVENVNVEFDAGYALSGTVMLPDDAYLANDVSVDIRAYGYNNQYYTEARGLTDDNRSMEYMMGINPFDEGSYVIEVAVYEESSNGGFSNILFDRSYYRVSDTENSEMEEDAERIQVSGHVTGVDVTLMTGVGIDVTMTMPSSIQDYCNANVLMYSSKGWLLTDEDIYFNQWSNEPDTKRFSLVTYEEDAGDEVYLAYEINTQVEGLCHSEMIYVSPDGTLSYLKEDAEPFILGEEGNEVSFTVAKTGEMECIMESEHPYQTGSVYTNEYTHPTDADYLEIYFTDDTSIAYNHTLTLQDADGNAIMYQGDNVMTIPGNYFKLVLNASSYSYYNNYGFKIVKVIGKNYEAESKHPYKESDLPIEYEYTHPDRSADALIINFSSATYIGSGATMRIYNGDDEVEAQYEGYLYNTAVEVSGNSFKIVIERTYQSFEDGAFGFAIESIEPIYMHTVTFKDYDGTVLDTQTVHDGDYAYYYDEDSLMRESADEDYIYVFTGWDKEDELEYVTKDITVTAQYDYVRAYKIVFKNIDGTILFEQRLPKNYGIFYDEENPVYPYESDVNYSFVGWDKPLEAVTGDMVFTAVFSKVYLESQHPYLSGSDEWFEYKEEGATSLKLTFSNQTQTESGYDKIWIYYVENGEDVLYNYYTGSSLAGVTIEVPSDTVKINLTSDGSVERYGFAVTAIEAVFDTEGVTMDADVTIYEGNGVETVVTLDLNKYIGGTAVVAAYDSDGDCMWVRRLVGEAMMNTAANAVTDEAPATVKVMLWGGNFDDMKPVLEPIVITSNEFDVIK